MRDAEIARNYVREVRNVGLIGALLGLVPVLMTIIWLETGQNAGKYWELPGPWMVLVANLLGAGVGAYMLLDGSWLIEIANRKRARPGVDAPIPEGEKPKTA